MPQTITREMLTIAVNRDTNKGHYVLKSMVIHSVKTRLTTSAETLCGLLRADHAHKVLSVSTSAAVTCVRCKQAFEKHERARLVRQKLKEVKMLKTSDGKIFPLTAGIAALKHEEGLASAKKQKGFITTVIETLFTEGGDLDEGTIEIFEEDLNTILREHFEDPGYESTLEEFLSFFYAMLAKHGAKLRNMIILYQRVHGSLVPCRNTMEKMKEDIYL